MTLSFVDQRKNRDHFGFRIGDRVRIRMDHKYESYRGQPGTVIGIPRASWTKAGPATWIKVAIDYREHPLTWYHSYFERLHR